MENFFCEICKRDFPLITNSPKTRSNIYLLKMLMDRSNYIVLKCKLIQDENKKSNTEYYFVEFKSHYRANPSIKIGRSVDCDIRLDDISVSRNHCLIYLDTKEEKLKIKDLKSKFGTLIKMTKDLNIADKATIQKGNTVYHFSLKFK